MISLRTLLTEEQLLERVPLTSRQLRRLREKRKVPFIKFGRRSIMYNLEKVVAALEKFEIKEEK
jgi:hypothetical protein